MADPISKRFLLPNNRSSVKPLVKEVLDHIIKIMPAHPDWTGILFKIEVIIIELLTNGIKHAGDTETFLEVVIYPDRLCLYKTDHGNRFDPGDIISSLGYVPGNKQLLTKDDLHSMYAVVDNDTHIKFECEEINDDGALDISTLIEHFGLLIITKASNSFKYHYDAVTALNTFSVTINLN